MTDATPAHSDPRWHAVAALAGVTLLVVINYGLRVYDLPLRGEESRWGQVAREMTHTGDWVVPRQQGEPFLSRPPLHAWTISASAAMFGRFDPLVVRFPSIVACVLTGLLVVLYSRRFVSWFAAGMAGAAYVTMGAVLQNARMGETEAVFTFLVSASLLVWHAGYCRGWRPAFAWSIGYGLAALGTLAKGPQAPCYFLGPVLIYLMSQRDWRWLVSWGHLLGILVYLGVVLAWIVPLYNAVGEDGVRAVFTGDVALHVAERTTTDAATHVAKYLAETLAVLLPWSLFLFAYLLPSVRRRASTFGSAWVFLGIALAVTYPTCLFVPGAKTRYFMSMFPLIAAWLAPLFQLLLDADAVVVRLRTVWRIIMVTVAFVGVVLVGGLVYVLLRGDLPSVAGFGQPLSVVVGFGVLMFAIAGGLFWASRAVARHRAIVAIMCFILFASLTSTWIGTNLQVAKSPRPAEEIAAVKARLAPGETITSFGPAHHLFAFYYGESIPMVPITARPEELPELFCYQCAGDLRFPFPFAVDELAAISMDRTRRNPPEIVTVVVRRRGP